MSHELGQFIDLMIKCNPNILELCLSLTDDAVLSHTHNEQLRDLLVEIFPYCLDPIKIRHAYGGFAHGQMKRMERHGDPDDPRRTKLIRHGFRVLGQGFELLESGTAKVRLVEEEIAILDDVVVRDNDHVQQLFTEMLSLFDDVDSSLSPGADIDLINETLVSFRRNNFSYEPPPPCI